MKIEVTKIEGKLDALFTILIFRYTKIGRPLLGPWLKACLPPLYSKLQRMIPAID
jgi:hypothetical protein